jgi:glycosyltransferase involved in cell wall biosynthesis
VKVCLVGYTAAGMLSSTPGGSERQLALLARGLAARGHETVLVATGLREDGLVVDGVRLRSGWDPDRGVRYVRAVYRYSHLWRALTGERADAYYLRGAGYYAPFVVQAARRAGGCSVVGLASDRDLYRESGKVLFGVPSRRLSAAIGPLAHAGFRRWALSSADWIAVQNEEQEAACEALGLRHARLPNIVEPVAPELAAVTAERDVVWAGNVSEGRRSKGLAELLRLAELLPEVSFTIAGRLDAPSCEALVARLRARPNVELVGALPHSETQRLIAAHRLVVNTSPSEGFSNVMLEGWALGRPSVTLAVDPSGLLSLGGLGLCAGGGLLDMAAATVALLSEPAAYGAMADRGRAYVRNEHAPERVCAAFERLVEGRLATSATGRGHGD